MNIAHWKYYAEYYRGSKKQLLLSLFVSVIQSIVILPIIFLVRHVFDEIESGGNLKALVLAGSGIIALNLISSGLRLWTRDINLRVTKNAVQRLQEDLLDRIYTFSRTFYNKNELGKIHSSLVQDIHRLDAMSNVLIANLIPGVVMTVAVSAILLFLNWHLFAIMLSTTPLLLLVNQVFGKKVKQRVQLWRTTFRNFNKRMLYVLQMLDLTRIQAAESFEKKNQRETFEQLRSTTYHMQWFQTAYCTIQNSIVAISGVLVLMIGGIAILDGSMSLGELASFYVAVGLLKSHLAPFITSIPQMMEGSESLASIHELVSTCDYVPYTGTKKVVAHGPLVLNSVHFKYDRDPILCGVNLTIQPGETVAILGANGVGKSTIINLILGFYKPDEGELSINSELYSNIDICNLRRSIGVVTQEAIIFSGTISENITYGNGVASEKEILRATKVAGADDFIKKLPQGYGTLVGDNGVLLSGGQRQRISLARAFLHQPKLLIFDEPTNHLDQAAVHSFVDCLREMKSPPAILIISHDMKILSQVQHRYFLKDGQIHWIPENKETSQIRSTNAQYN